MKHTKTIPATVQLARLFRPGRECRSGTLVVVGQIDRTSCPMQTKSRRPQRVGFRGMWYGQDPRTIDSFGKVEWGGMIPVGKAGRRISPWLARKLG
jgi:hypothetical protein